MTNFSWQEFADKIELPIAKTGYSFIFASAFATVIIALLGFATLTFILLGITFFICYFFRDPERIIPKSEGAVVSPADGTVIKTHIVDDSPFYEGKCMKVSIFMSLFNVHVNRIPYTGNVKKIGYHPGKFFSANLDKASRHNEHNAVFLETKRGEKICVVQIAGLIARRIICKIYEDEDVKRGQRFGMICFGSRLDVYLPANIQLKATVGDKVKGGSSILGYLL